MPDLDGYGNNQRLATSSDFHTCGSLWISATARSGVLSFRYSSADAVLVHLTPLPPVAPAGAWSAGGIESISPKQTLTEKHKRGCIEGWDGGQTRCCLDRASVSRPLSTLPEPVEARRGMKRQWWGRGVTRNEEDSGHGWYVICV